MQLIIPLTFLALAFVELTSALVVSPKSYNQDPYESGDIHADELKSLKGIQKILKKADIIDEVLDPFIPSCYVVPSYSSKRVKLGNTIKPSKTQDAPSLGIFCPGKKDVSGGLTVILTDPDAPSRNDDSLSEMCHWIARVPGVMIGKLGVVADVNASDLLHVVDYKPPAPPKGTGKHRYVFVLLEGENEKLQVPEQRKRWGFETPGSGVREWAGRENLTVLGANFHLEKYHEGTKDSQFEI
ncbi:hypothetical protein DSL72_007184 [Monilinia vaccinii-corymbosi]|uniref:Phosphatidylethanolamine-binding protein n=1 Tax=Monilinia vaccinii-corymbosi TaxID=61207 RepID=A0A8A3PLQ3_9HELO|nr:hypothetical protein DSL72_007184 [Monilinia vaccinii-corymbosi]